MKRLKKIAQVLPFLTVCGIMCYTWFEFISGRYVANWMHYAALLLVIGNAVLYFLRFRVAVLVTGIVLALATLNFLAFTAAISTWTMRIVSVETPPIQPLPLLLLVIFGAINLDFFIGWHLDAREAAQKRK